MLSRDCGGCSQLRTCSKRYSKVGKGEKVYCSDGTAHLVDDGAVLQNADICEQHVDLVQ